MGYVLYHISSKRRIKWFFTERGALAARTAFNRSACDWVYDIKNEKDFDKTFDNNVEVKDPLIGLCNEI